MDTESRPEVVSFGLEYHLALLAWDLLDLSEKSSVAKALEESSNYD